MAAEGEFPKVDGDILYASEINNILNRARAGFKLNNRMLNPYNPLNSPSNIISTRFYADIAATKTNLTADTTNAEYTCSSGTYTFESQDFNLTDTVTTGFGDIDYDIYTVYDEFADGLVDSSLWSGSPTETGGYLQQSGTGETYSNDLSGSSMFCIKGVIRARGTSDVARAAYLDLTDGTNDQNILSAASSLSGDDVHYTFALNFYVVDWASKLVQVTGELQYLYDIAESATYRYRYKTSYTNLFTLSSLSDLRVQLRASAGTVDTYCRIYYLRCGNQNPSTTANFSLSADGGSNYESAYIGTNHSFTDTGSAMKAKLTGTVGSGEVIVLRGYSLGWIS